MNGRWDHIQNLADALPSASPFSSLSAKWTATSQKAASALVWEGVCSSLRDRTLHYRDVADRLMHWTCMTLDIFKKLQEAADWKQWYSGYTRQRIYNGAPKPTYLAGQSCSSAFYFYKGRLFGMTVLIKKKTIDVILEYLVIGSRYQVLGIRHWVQGTRY